MAFDDRHTELLTVLGLVGMAVGASVPLLHKLGFEGWYLAGGTVVCAIVAYVSVFLLLNFEDIIAWLRSRIGRDQ